MTWEDAIAKGPEAFGREVAAGDRGAWRRKQAPGPVGVPVGPGARAGSAGVAAGPPRVAEGPGGVAQRPAGFAAPATVAAGMAALAPPSPSGQNGSGNG